MTETVIAFDPGGTTGVAILTPTSRKRIHVRQLTEIWELLNRYSPDEVVVERFQFRYGGGRSKVDLTAKEVIGVIKLWCALKNVPLFEQTPSQAKNLWTDKKLKQLDLWLPMPHAMDATRHLLYHLVVTKGDRSWLEQLKPRDSK